MSSGPLVFWLRLSCSVNFRGLGGRERKCSAGFQPAKVLLTQKGVVEAQMPARRRRYDFFSRPVSLR